MDNTVEMMQPGSVLDDAAQAQAEALSSIVNEQPTEQQTQPEAPAVKSEPGWIKQRVNAAVEKAIAETEARLTAKYEAMLAPMRESMLDREAAQLVQEGEFKSLDRAKEYVRLKNGVNPPADPAPAQQTQQPTRDAQGRFMKSEGPKQEDGDPVVRARADLLAKQAQKVKEGYGVDVMQVFNTDPEARQRVLSGEWDFYDVAAYAASGGRNVPVPMRSANGMGMANGGVSIANMSDEQFARLQNNLASGHSYDMRR